MGCSQFHWGLMSEFWCSALKTPVAQPCSVSPLPMLLAVQSGKEKCLSQSLSPPTPCSLSYSVSKTFEWKQGKKAAQGSNNPSVLPTGDSPSLCISSGEVTQLSGPWSNRSKQSSCSWQDKGDGPKLCQAQHARAVCVPSKLRALPKGSTTGLHQLIFTESCIISNWAQQQRSTWAV